MENEPPWRVLYGLGAKKGAWFTFTVFHAPLCCCIGMYTIEHQPFDCREWFCGLCHPHSLHVLHPPSKTRFPPHWGHLIDLVSAKSLLLKAMDLVKKDLQDTSYLVGPKERLKECDKKIDNIMSIIEQGIVFWLSSFKNGNINDVEYQQRVIDTLPPTSSRPAPYWPKSLLPSQKAPRPGYIGFCGPLPS